MAYTKTINADQIFVRDIFFRDFGNRPISSGNVLVTRGDGGVYFSNLSTSGIYAFNTIIADGVPVIKASNTGSNAISFGAGPGIGFAVDNTINPNKLVIQNLGIQQLHVNNDNTTISFSNLPVPTPAGRTLTFGNEGEIYIRTSTNTVIFGSAYTSSYSSILSLQSTQLGIGIIMSTNYAEYSTLIGEVDIYFLSTSISSFYSTLTSTENLSQYLSTFVFTTFADDGNGNHNQLQTSTIRANSVSTNYISTKQLYIGNNHIYDSTLYTNNNYCSFFVANGTLNAVENDLHLTDNITTVDVTLKKTGYTNRSTTDSSTFTTFANQYQLGLTQQYSNAPNVYPILQQIEVIKYAVDSNSISTITNYALKNSIVLDELCAPSTFNLNAGGNVYISTTSLNTCNIRTNNLNTSSILTSSLTYNTAAGNKGYLSSLNISTIAGQMSPILTFDPINNRIGVNLGTDMPNATIDVSGVIMANNFVTVSDRRLKQNIQEMPFMKPLKSYTYIMEGYDDIGVIADEVEEIAPCCVYTRPDGYKSVSYPKLVPILLSYINELRTRIETIECEMLKGIVR